jgi:hypothetical protein
VPVATAAFADVLVRDARERVGGRVEEELLAGAAGFLLAASTGVEFPADRSGLRGQVVADALELGEAQERRPGATDHRRRDRRPERAKLLVEPSDLVTERAPGGRVVRLERWKDRRVDGQGHVIRLWARSD